MKHLTKKEFANELKKIQLENEQFELRNKLKAEKRKIRQSKRKKIKTSNKVLISTIIAIVGYTIASLCIQYHTGVEVSSTLTTLWFSFWTVEIVALTGIKISKVMKNCGSSSNKFSNEKENIIEKDITEDNTNSIDI